MMDEGRKEGGKVGWKDGKIGKYTDDWVDGWEDRDKRTDGWMDGQVDERWMMDGWVSERMDGWIHGGCVNE